MNWLNSTLGKVLICANSGTWGNPPAGNGSDYPILRSTNITDGRLSFEDIAFRYVSHEVAKKYILQSGDIIVTTSSGSSHLIGKNALFINPEDGQKYLFSNFTYCLRPNKKLIIPKFLYYYLNSNAAKAELLRIQSTTSGLRNLNTRLYLTQKISVPSMSEQNRIVEILDRADELRKKRSEADAKAERILPVLFYKMFGDPALNTKGWEKTTLIASGAAVRYGLGQPPKSDSNGVPLIRATNIRRGMIYSENMLYVNPDDVPQSRNAYLQPEEVIVVRSGAYTGDVAQVTEKWVGAVAGYDLIVSPGINFTGEFIETYLLTSHIQNNYFSNLKARAGQPHLNSEQLSNTPIYKPPKSMQASFSEKVNRIRKYRERIKKCDEQINKLFTVIVYRAFSGDLTAKWREAHMKELLTEMEEQAKCLSNEVTT